MSELNESIESTLFNSIVAVGVREEGTVTDLDTLIIDRQKAVDNLEALFQSEIEKAKLSEAKYVENYWDGEEFHADKWQERIEHLKSQKERIVE